MQKKTEKGAGKQEGAGSYVGVGWGYACRARPQQAHTHRGGAAQGPDRERDNI